MSRRCCQPRVRRGLGTAFLRWHRLDSAVVSATQRPAPLVHLSMMATAEQYQMSKFGRPTVGPVLDVVCVGPVGGAIASHELASPIAEDESSSDRGRHAA